MTSHTRLLLVGQDSEAIAALRRACDGQPLEVIGDTGFGSAALTWARGSNPALIAVIAEEPLARPLATLQVLAQGTPPWTVVALVDRFEPELVRKLLVAGARDVLVRGMPAAELRSALLATHSADQARRAPPADSTAPAGTVVAIFGPKGGCGKTTLASNLAIGLAQETERSVALVDLDLPFGDIAFMLDMRPDHDLLTALDPEVLAEPDRLQSLLLPGPGGISVLSGPRDAQAAVDHVRGSQLAELLSRLASVYDFVVADCAVGVGEASAAALDAATLALMITTSEAHTLRRAQSCLRLLHGWDFTGDHIKLVLNRTSSHTGVREDEVEAIAGYPIAWRVPNDAAVVRATATGVPALMSRPNSQFARAIRQMARGVAGVPEPRPRSGWIARTLAALPSTSVCL